MTEWQKQLRLIRKVDEYGLHSATSQLDVSVFEGYVG